VCFYFVIPSSFLLFYFVIDVVYRVSQEERSILWEVVISANLSKKLYMYMFRTVSEISLFHCRIPKLLIRKILRTVSNTGIYCSSDKVGTIYRV
jgi:hypothetical protein